MANYFMNSTGKIVNLISDAKAEEIREISNLDPRDPDFDARMGVRTKDLKVLALCEDILTEYDQMLMQSIERAAKAEAALERIEKKLDALIASGRIRKE